MDSNAMQFIIDHGVVFVDLRIKATLKFIYDYFLRRPPVYSLSDLDPLFEDTISELSLELQKGYCRRLIDRSKFDLNRTVKRERAEHLEKLITAAEIELFELSS